MSQLLWLALAKDLDGSVKTKDFWRQYRKNQKNRNVATVQKLSMKVNVNKIFNQ